MNNEQFRDLLQRYLNGSCSAYEVFMLQEWYTQLGEESRHSLSESEQRFLEAKIWQNIQEETTEAPTIPLHQPRWWQQPIWLRVAAVVLLVSSVAVGYRLLSFSDLSNQLSWIDRLTTAKKQIHQENNTDEVQQIILHDKTIVWLSPGSQLTYPRQFSPQKREVTLVGDAFFDVAKNPKKPFLVYTNTLVTQVLGTSFWIRVNPEKKVVDVEVVTGKVSVFERNTSYAAPATGTIRQKVNSVVLTPNHRVTYFTENGLLTTGLVKNPVPLHTDKAVVNQAFVNKALPDIMRQLQQEYGIDIILANEKLEHCTFTGDVNGLALYEKLRIICKSIGATCEISGTHLLITGDGCDG